MTVTVFGIGWVILNIFAFLRSYKSLFVVLLLSCIFQASAVVMFGDVAVAPWVFTSAVFIFKSICSGLTIDENNVKIKKMFLFMFYVLGVTVVALFVFRNIYVPIAFKKNIDWTGVSAIYRRLKLTTLHITNSIIFILFCFDFICVESKLKNIKLTWLNKTIKKIIFFVAIIGLIQFVSVTFDLSTFLLEKFIYSDTSNLTVSIYRSGNFYRLYSTFTEPSYFGAFAAAAFWYLYYQERRICFTNVLLLAEIVLARSSTGYAAFVIGFLLYLTFNRKIGSVTKLVIMGIIIYCLLIFTGYWDVIYNNIANKGSSISGIERNAWNTEAIKLMRETMFIGVGFSSFRASSFLLNMLCQIGIIGTALFSSLIYSVCKGGVGVKICNEQKPYILFILVILAAQVVACPDLVFTALWFGIFINLAVSKATNDGVNGFECEEAKYVEALGDSTDETNKNTA